MEKENGFIFVLFFGVIMNTWPAAHQMTHGQENDFWQETTSWTFNSCSWFVKIEMTANQLNPNKREVGRTRERQSQVTCLCHLDNGAAIVLKTCHFHWRTWWPSVCTLSADFSRVSHNPAAQNQISNALINCLKVETKTVSQEATYGLIGMICLGMQDNDNNDYSRLEVTERGTTVVTDVPIHGSRRVKENVHRLVQLNDSVHMCVCTCVQAFVRNISFIKKKGAGKNMMDSKLSTTIKHSFHIIC